MDNLREKVIKGLECVIYPNRFCGDCSYFIRNENDPDTGWCDRDAIYKDALSLLKAQEPQWRPFVKRALTEEEQKHHPDWCYILDGEVPEDEEEILVYRPWNNKAGYIIEMDTYCNNGDEVYLDGAGDIENGMYWMPLPEPPKEET